MTEILHHIETEKRMRKESKRRTEPELMEKKGRIQKRLETVGNNDRTRRRQR